MAEQKINTAEDLVAFASGVLEHPTVEQIEEMLRFLSTQDRDFAISGIEDRLLDMRAELLQLDALMTAESPALPGEEDGASVAEAVD